MLAEEKGHQTGASSRKANESARNDLQKALEGRKMIISEDELKIMGDLIPCCDIWLLI